MIDLLIGIAFAMISTILIFLSAMALATIGARPFKAWADWYERRMRR